MIEQNNKNCPECDAPTLEQTSTQENCYNCGYDNEYADVVCENGAVFSTNKKAIERLELIKYIMERMEK